MRAGVLDARILCARLIRALCGTRRATVGVAGIVGRVPGGIAGGIHDGVHGSRRALRPPRIFMRMSVLWITPRAPRNIHDARTSNEQNARIRRFYDKPRRIQPSPASSANRPPATTNHAPSHPVTDNGRMYVLLSPATGAGITAQTGTPAHPVTSAIAAGASPRGAQPVTSWGAFHFRRDR